MVILVFNEDRNIEDCLESIGDWVNKIFIVDSFSTDRIIDLIIDRKDPIILVVQHAFEYYSKKWNCAFANLPLKFEWNFKVDADERVTSEFKDEVDRRLQVVAPNVEGFLFKRSTVFVGRRLRHVGVLRSDLRLWRTGTCRFDGSSMNEYALISRLTEYLNNRIDYHDNKSITDWLKKHNLYSLMTAINFCFSHYKRGIQAYLFENSVSRISWLPTFYRKLSLRSFGFLYLFFMKRGFLSERYGLHYCILYNFYEYITDLKLLEWRLTGRVPFVPVPPRGAPGSHLIRCSQKQQ